MHWMKKLLAVVIVLAVLAVAVGLMLPSAVHVERRILIAAPASAVFPYVNDYRLFNRWSPWAKKDPGTRYTYSGPESGVGAKLGWTSKVMGEGSQEILESDPDRRVKVALDFGEMGRASATYSLQVEGGGTRVTWGFDEDFGNNLLARYFGLVLERFIGEDYEQGLANLKAVVESGKK
jgi:hypothetical protein